MPLERFVDAAHDPLGETVKLCDAFETAADMDSKLAVGPGKMFVGGLCGCGFRLLRHRLELLGLLQIVVGFCLHVRISSDSTGDAQSKTGESFALCGRMVVLNF